MEKVSYPKVFPSTGLKFKGGMWGPHHHICTPLHWCSIINLDFQLSRWWVDHMVKLYVLPAEVIILAGHNLLFGLGFLAALQGVSWLAMC